MGGIRDEVRGKTKVGTWIRFKKDVMAKFGRRPYELYLEYPTKKRHAYSSMYRDEATGEWILRFRFGK